MRTLHLFMLLLGVGGWHHAQAQVYTYTTSGTFSVPSGATEIQVEVWGGGGAGGGARGSSGFTDKNGAGGGGGAYATRTYSVAGGNMISGNISYTVGNGGAGASNGTGGSGAASYFNGTSGATAVYAPGGNGGVNNSTTAGAGGAASAAVGTTKTSGNSGLSGSGNTGGNGGTGGIPGGGTGGNGGSNGNGSAGDIPGGGGGGAGSNGGFFGNGTARTGGAGGKGQVQITILVPCAGTPPTAVAAGPTNVCSGESVILTATGVPTPTTSGITKQWQIRPAGIGVFVDIPGATTVPYTAASQTMSMEYRLVLTCTNGGATSTSNVLSVGMKLPSACQACTPTYTTGCSDEYIDDFSLTGEGGTSINHTFTGCGGAGYTNYSNLSANVLAGGSYPVSIYLDGPLVGTEYLYIWVDLNGNNVFETSEILLAGGPLGAGYVTGTLSIPAGTTSGTKKMRVRMVYNTNPIDPCASYTYGETHDYTLVVLPPACSGMPTAGAIANNGQSAYCQNAPALNFVSYGYSMSSGLQFQWRKSTDGVNYSDISGATGLSYTSTATTVTTSYLLKVTCGSGGPSATTAPVTVTVSNPTPVATPASATICSGNTTSIALSAASTGTTFSWPAPSVSGSTITGASAGSGSTISQTLTNTGINPALVTYTVTGTVNGTCTANNTVSITVNPGASVTLTPAAPNRACGSGLTQLTAITAAGATVAFDPLTDIYTDAAGTIPYTLASNATTVYVNPSTQITYNVTSSNSCGTGNNSGSVVVSSSPTSLAGSGVHSDLYTQSGTVNILDENCDLIATIQSAGGSSATGLTTASVNSSASTGVTGTGEPYVGRVYDIEPQTAPSTSTANITLYYTQADFDAYNLYLDNNPQLLAFGYTKLPADEFDANQGNIKVTQFHGTGGFSYGTGIQISSPFVSYNSTNGWWEINFPVVGFSTFFLTGGNPQNAPLPVSLISLKVANEGARNRVDWTSATEKNLNHYEVEHAADGKTFAKIDEVKAEGKAFSYIVYDRKPNDGVNYYRLKMVDNDGTFAYSKTVTATVRGGNAGFTATTYPNPVANSLTVEVYGGAATGGQVELTDAAGKLVGRYSLDATRGYTTIDMSAVAAGLYFVKYSDASHTETIKVTKN